METKFYKITKNGRELKNYLAKEEAIELLPILVDQFSSGYHYAPEENIIYNEVIGLSKSFGEKGDEIIVAGDDVFEITEENIQEDDN